MFSAVLSVVSRILPSLLCIFTGVKMILNFYLLQPLRHFTPLTFPLHYQLTAPEDDDTLILPTSI